TNEAKPSKVYLHILWRNSPKSKIKDFKLTTVTYGTASAPYLATRVLAEIGNRCQDQSIKDVIINDFYMDDLMTGSDSIEKSKKIVCLISMELEKVGMNLRKWISNEKEIIDTVENAGENKVLSIEETESVKTLGLQWEPFKDEFKF
ncbi:hypothetical protein KR222_004608, partial [Zaprionus bogoriensis]